MCTSSLGLLPICANCKMIRDDGGAWTPPENYISEHSEGELHPRHLPELHPPTTSPDFEQG
ncbi:MAG: hypothetical protein IPL96_17855 [Holophagaceae bacterium]|nr:hypothetical protein [Holophagaceae bacterium]